MTELAPPVSLPTIFAALASAAQEYAASGRVLYGAQAKKLLMKDHPGFSETAFGYTKFIELLVAGRDAGQFELEVPNGHPRILPAGTAPTAERAAPPTARLKFDVWTTFVLWGDGERWWDAKRRRATFVPTDDAGTPLWEASPEDFVRVDPVTMQMQLAWMEEFAREQDPARRDALLATLSAEASGEFKQALGRVNLSLAWRERLRQRVTTHALSWAATNGLPADAILERHERATRTASTKISATERTPSASRTTESASVDSASALRARLHEVIDQMSTTELMALQVPAAYLLRS